MISFIRGDIGSSKEGNRERPGINMETVVSVSQAIS